MWKLLSHDKCPPGEFRYAQEHAGRVKRFGPGPLIHELAKGVAAFRAANGLPRSSPQEALEDIDSFTCQRLGNMPRFCYDSENPVVNAFVSPSGPQPCPTCGHH